MRTPPLLADFSHARPCKPFCENSLTLPIIPLVKQHIKLIHNIIVKTPSSRFTGLRNLFAERENKKDIQKDVLFVLVEISGIEPLTS